jgi:predicted kinase
MELNILVAAAGAGKSTWAANNTNESTVIVSSDEARFLISGDEGNQECSGRAFAFMELAVEMLLRQRKNVIVDATNTTRKSRKQWVKLGRKYGARVQMTVFNVPADVCKARNAARARKVPEHVIDSMLARLEIPVLFDECDEILVIEG